MTSFRAVVIEVDPRLIAAAPRLYDALVALLRTHGHTNEDLLCDECLDAYQALDSVHGGRP